jgi:hypothetical protein
MKLGNIQQAMEILNPLLEEKCPVQLSLDILNIINELQPESEKLNTIKQNLIKQYSILDEEGRPKTKMNPDNMEIYDFGDDEEKVNEEVIKLMETEIEINSKIDTCNFDSDIKIEPIKLKILYDFGLLNN